MATPVQVSCINKTNRFDPHDRIHSIGGINQDGTSWKLSQVQAIEGIKAGTWSFYVNQGGSSVWVVIGTSRYGHEYLKTQADGEQPDNLLSLPECH